MKLSIFVTVYGRPDKYNEGLMKDMPQDYEDDEDGDTAEKDNKGTSSGPPAILSQPVNYDVDAGKTVEFPCERINTGLFIYLIKKI